MVEMREHLMAALLDQKKVVEKAALKEKNLVDMRVAWMVAKMAVLKVVKTVVRWAILMVEL